MSPGLIHVGAWDGREYVAEARHSPRNLLLIEPQADAFRRLEQNFGACDRVVLANVAVGAGEGEVEMYRSSPDYSSSVLEPKEHLRLFPAITFDGRERVRMTTLDRLTEEQATVYRDLVIDVQGYELEVLKGAEETLAEIRWLKCEVSTVELYDGNADLDQIDAFLVARGFKQHEIDLWAEVHGDVIYAR